MKSLVVSAISLAFVLGFFAPAHALVADGITYTLTENSISGDGKTASFTFTASGENTASDTEGGGRTGINAIAFNQPSPGTVVSGTMTSPSGFTFVLGGLNSDGCDGNGNFYCFDNTAIVDGGPAPTTLLSGTQTFNFSVTADTAGVWAGYTTDLKIDWVGEKNNYDLVSLPIAVTPGPICTDCTPTPNIIVPEPGALGLLGTALLSMWGGLRWRIRRRHYGHA